MEAWSCWLFLVLACLLCKVCKNRSCSQGRVMQLHPFLPCDPSPCRMNSAMIAFITNFLSFSFHPRMVLLIALLSHLCVSTKGPVHVPSMAGEMFAPVVSCAVTVAHVTPIKRTHAPWCLDHCAAECSDHHAGLVTVRTAEAAATPSTFIAHVDALTV